jgi:hypothetical protein
MSGFFIKSLRLSEQSIIYLGEGSPKLFLPSIGHAIKDLGLFVEYASQRYISF